MKQIQQLFGTIGALAAGAGAMYYLDPQQGRRRRATAGDKLGKASHEVRDYTRMRVKRAADKSRGLLALLRGLWRPEVQLSDEQLHERVRSRLGRLVSHPRAIETQVENGRVHLRGAVLARELKTLLAGLRSLPGVAGVENELGVHDAPGSEPALQGEDSPPRKPSRLQKVVSLLAIATPIVIAAGAVRYGGRHSPAQPFGR